MQAKEGYNNDGYYAKFCLYIYAASLYPLILLYLVLEVTLNTTVDDHWVTDLKTWWIW